jgi:hypothetical protein
VSDHPLQTRTQAAMIWTWAHRAHDRKNTRVVHGSHSLAHTLQSHTLASFVRQAALMCATAHVGPCRQGVFGPAKAHVRGFRAPPRTGRSLCLWSTRSGHHGWERRCREPSAILSSAIPPSTPPDSEVTQLVVWQWRLQNDDEPLACGPYQAAGPIVLPFVGPVVEMLRPTNGNVCVPSACHCPAP